MKLCATLTFTAGEASRGSGVGGVISRGWERVMRGGRGHQDGLPATGIKLSLGTGDPVTTRCPITRALNSTVARTCRVIPGHRVVDTSRMAFSKKDF